VVQSLRKRQPDIVVIFVTAAITTDTLQRITASNPDRVLSKPVAAAGPFSLPIASEPVDYVSIRVEFHPHQNVCSAGVNDRHL